MSRSPTRSTTTTTTPIHTYILFVERSFPVEYLMSQAATPVGITRWRIRSDTRGFMRPGKVEIELRASTRQLAELERRWERALELVGETTSSF